MMKRLKVASVPPRAASHWIRAVVFEPQPGKPVLQSSRQRALVVDVLRQVHGLERPLVAAGLLAACVVVDGVVERRGHKPFQLQRGERRAQLTSA